MRQLESRPMAQAIGKLKVRFNALEMIINVFQHVFCILADCLNNRKKRPIKMVCHLQLNHRAMLVPLHATAVLPYSQATNPHQVAPHQMHLSFPARH